MAKDKKGFLLYADQKELFDSLDDEQAGQLIKHIMSYVNDENPTSKNPLINIAFIPIRQQLKRDLEKFEDRRKQNSEAGKRSAEARKAKREAAKSTSVKSVERSSTNSTDNDNDNDNDNGIDNDISVIEENTNTPKAGSRFTPPTIEEIEDEMKLRNVPIDKAHDAAEHFHNHYSAQGWTLGNGRPLLDWKAKVKSWVKDEKFPAKFKKQKEYQRPKLAL